VSTPELHQAAALLTAACRVCANLSSAPLLEGSTAPLLQLLQANASMLAACTLRLIRLFDAHPSLTYRLPRLMALELLLAISQVRAVATQNALMS